MTHRMRRGETTHKHALFVKLVTSGVRLTTNQIKDRIGYSRTTVLAKLKILEAKGLVKSELTHSGNGKESIWGV